MRVYMYTRCRSETNDKVSGLRDDNDKIAKWATSFIYVDRYVWGYTLVCVYVYTNGECGISSGVSVCVESGSDEWARTLYALTSRESRSFFCVPREGGAGLVCSVSIWITVVGAGESIF